MTGIGAVNRGQLRVGAQRVRDRLRRRRAAGDRRRAAGRRRDDRGGRRRRDEARARAAARRDARGATPAPRVRRSSSRRSGRSPAAASSTRSRWSARRTTIRQAWDVLRPGGTAVVVGLAPAGVEVSLPAIEFLSEKTITGSYYGSAESARALGRLVQLVVDGRLELADVVSDLIELEDVEEALERLRRGEGGALGGRDRRGARRASAKWASRWSRLRRADRRGLGRRSRAERLSRQRRARRARDRRPPPRCIGDVHHARPGHTPILVVVGEEPGQLRAGVAADDHDQQGHGARRPPSDDHLGRGAAGDRAGRARRGGGRADSSRAASWSCSCAYGSTRRVGRDGGAGAARVATRKALGVAVAGGTSGLRRRWWNGAIR